MPFWQRLVITVVAMIGMSFVVGLIWSRCRLHDPELPERHDRRADRAAGLGVPQAGRAAAPGGRRRRRRLRRAEPEMRFAEHPAGSPYQTGLGRNPANHAPLTPISFLERAADVFPEPHRLDPWRHAGELRGLPGARPAASRRRSPAAASARATPSR